MDSYREQQLRPSRVGPLQLVSVGKLRSSQESSEGKGENSVSPSLSVSKTDLRPAAALSKPNGQRFRRLRKTWLESEKDHSFLLFCQNE